MRLGSTLECITIGKKTQRLKNTRLYEGSND
jgi:hypothetical protein